MEKCKHKWVLGLGIMRCEFCGETMLLQQAIAFLRTQEAEHEEACENYIESLREDCPKKDRCFKENYKCLDCEE